MDLADDILAHLPMSQLASQLGTDPATAEQAVRQAVPALVGGMHANAGAGGSDSLLGALGQHAGNGLLDGGVDLNQIDTADGGAIVNHVFGAANTGQVAQRLGSRSGVSSELISKVLPIIAPIVLSWLANKVLGGSSGGQAGTSGSSNPQFNPAGGQPAQGQPASTGGLGDLLGQVLGGALGGGGGAGGLGGGLGNILGDLLGQGRR